MVCGRKGKRYCKYIIISKVKKVTSFLDSPLSKDSFLSSEKITFLKFIHTAEHCIVNSLSALYFYFFPYIKLTILHFFNCSEMFQVMNLVRILLHFVPWGQWGMRNQFKMVVYIHILTPPCNKKDIHPPKEYYICIGYYFYIN